MMIAVRQEEPGLIIIDFSADRDFDMSNHGVELTSGFFVSEMLANSIVVEDTGFPGQLLDDIWSSLTSMGFEVEFDADCGRLRRLYQEEQGLVKAIQSGTTKPARLGVLPRIGVKRSLLKHQLSAVKHALKVRNAANFSVPGSGKTTVALTVYAAFVHSHVVEGLVVIGPASSFAPWEDEFELTLARKPRVVRLIGNRRRREELLRELEGVDIILCTYQMAYMERESLIKLLKKRRYLLVLDESHHIKNINLGPWAKTAVELAPFAERRMILSGTPAPHSVKDLWSQFTFLWPSRAVLSTRLGFERRMEASKTPVEDLQATIAPFFVRTKKSDLHLPAPHRSFIKIPPSEIPERQRLIIRLLDLKTLRDTRTLGLQGMDMAILQRWRRARTLRLLQAASNPALLSTTLLGETEFGEPLDQDPQLARLLRNYLRHETPAKFTYVVEKVRQIVSEGRKVIVWATFVENIRLLGRYLEDLTPLKIYGEIPAYDDGSDSDFENRERSVREFNSPGSGRNVLLVTPAACSESVSLHKCCSDAIYLERTFNCGQFLQSMDRIHRVGMPRGKHPHYYFPILECPIEEVVDRRLRDRQEVLYRLLEDDMPVMGLPDDESFLIEQEEEIEFVFAEVLQKIAAELNEPTARTPRDRPRRRAS